MKISANEIKSGTVLDYDHGLWIVTKNPEHTKPGKGGAYVQVEMKNLRTGSKLNQRFSSTDSVEKAFIEHKNMQYLYTEDKNLVLMDLESFDQILVNSEMLHEKLPLLTDNMELLVEFYQEKVISLKLPPKMVVEIDQTDPVIKGATITSSFKPAIIVGGLKVMVPPYLNTGEKIVIKTDDLSFLEREK